MGYIRLPWLKSLQHHQSREYGKLPNVSSNLPEKNQKHSEQICTFEKKEGKPKESLNKSNANVVFKASGLVTSQQWKVEQVFRLFVP